MGVCVREWNVRFTDPGVNPGPFPEVGGQRMVSSGR
jgi:predicted neutral ceramidase superfamily lipid hydrolase